MIAPRRTNRILGFFGVGFFSLLFWGCGLPDRNNPTDPDVANRNQEVEIVATLPLDGETNFDVLKKFSYTVDAEDFTKPVTGEMNFVGNRASALIQGIELGVGRWFRVDVFDDNGIRTFTAEDTIDVEQGSPQIVSLVLVRITGIIELNSNLPPEIVELEVAVQGDDDSLRFKFEAAGSISVRMEGVPTGTDIGLALQGRDVDGQLIVVQKLQTDVRIELVARVGPLDPFGALHVVANFPSYIPIVSIDRFGDSFGTFFRRSVNSNLPSPNEPINFDENFLLKGLGPDGQGIEFYHFDVHSPEPAPIYFFVDAFGSPIEGQLPVFDQIPGDDGYNDLRLIHQVYMTDKQYRPNTITAFADIEAGGYEIVPSGQVMNCVLAPDGSKASKRNYPTDIPVLQEAWYKNQIAKYFLFENPESIAPIEFVGDEVNTPLMYAFFENDIDFSDGFAIDRVSGGTHNVATRLPSDAGYSPLWALIVFNLGAFDRVSSVATAQDQARNVDNLLPMAQVLHVNAPIVGVFPGN